MLDAELAGEHACNDIPIDLSAYHGATLTLENGVNTMSKRDFESKCRELEALGYTATEYEPYAKYAVYQLKNITKIIGSKK